MALTAGEKLQFLDVTSYLAAGTSLDSFLKAFGTAGARKLHFPYSWFDTFEKLTYPDLPTKADFADDLRCRVLTDTDYAACRNIWTEHDMTTMLDYLRFYNTSDVEPMLVAVERMMEFYRERNICMLSDGISLPGLCSRYLFKNLPPTTFFSTFDDGNRDLYMRLREEVCGRPALVFTRYAEAGVTNITPGPHQQPLQCKSILGLDANSLYLSAIAKPMPTSHLIRRR